MYFSYAEIDSISSNSGGINGGLRLTVTGQNFDETDANATILVGGKECVIERPIPDINTAITCLTPTPPSSTPSVYLG